jgi:prepilin-type N-terminal cleavage/methylation domain-containing protein
MKLVTSRTLDAVVYQEGRRRGFTVLEIMAALGLLSIAVVLLSQIAFGELAERRRQISRQEVLEAAANLLESARAGPTEAITPEWAAAQRLPGPLAQRLLDSKLKVTVEPYKSAPKLKRVKVEITWLHDKGLPARPVVLTAFYGPRTAPQTESKP